MTTNPVAVWCGTVSVTESQLRERGRRLAGALGAASGRLVPIVDNNRVRALLTAWGVRASGGIPLVGDDRWNVTHWSELRQLAVGAVLSPDSAWAAFSSGSSGSPRVILRSEQSWCASFSAVTELMELTSSDCVYLPAPLSSSLSLFSVAHARSVGAAVVLPRAHSFSPADLEHATALHATPHALRTLVEAIEAGAIRHHLHSALVGGAHLDVGVRERAQALGIRVVSYYGAAELSFVAVDTDGLGHRPFPGVELRVTDGELWVRSPYLASGYLASGYLGTDGALRQSPGGWATVGDLVVLDRADRLHFRGRVDGAILTAAATVVPEEVESALRSIDGIEDAIVLGLANGGVGALVSVVIETTPGSAVPSVRHLREEARSRLAPSHLPRRWYWTERLPRTPAGKPARAQVRLAIENGEVNRLD